MAGLRYNLELEVGESDYCEKEDDVPLESAPSIEECPVDNMDTVSVTFAGSIYLTHSHIM